MRTRPLFAFLVFVLIMLVDGKLTEEEKAKDPRFYYSYDLGEHKPKVNWTHPSKKENFICYQTLSGKMFR